MHRDAGRIRSELPAGLPGAVAMALADACLRAGYDAETDLAAVRLLGHVLLVEADLSSPSFGVPPLADRRFAEAAVRRIAPDVREVRRRIFGAAKPPFADETRARAWLAGAEACRPEPVPSGFQRRMDSLAREMREAGFPVRWERAFERVWQWCPPGRYGWAYVDEGNDFALLGRAARRLEETTGAPELHLTLHILTGSGLIVPAARIRFAPPDDRPVVPRVAAPLSREGIVQPVVHLRLTRPLAPARFRDLQRALAGVAREYAGRDLDEVVRGVLGPRAGTDWSPEAWEAVAEAWVQAGRPPEEPRALRARYRRRLGPTA